MNLQFKFSVSLNLAYPMATCPFENSTLNFAENVVLLKKYVIPSMHYKNYAEWLEFVCTTMLETNANSMLNSLKSHGFFNLVINASIHYWKLYPF